MRSSVKLSVCALLCLVAACSGGEVASTPVGVSESGDADRVHYSGPARAVLSDHFRPQPREEAEPESALEVAEVDESYRVLGRLFEGRLSLDEVSVGAGARARVSAEPSALQRGCPAEGSVGVAYVAGGMPPELGIWLALVDLYKQGAAETRAVVDERGRGTHLHTIQSASGDLESQDGAYSQSDVLREVLAFRVDGAVTCRAQHKRYLMTEDVDDSPAARAARALRGPDESAAAAEVRFGLTPDMRGQLLWEHQATPEGYGLKVHIANDLGSTRTPGGEVNDRTLICASQRPLFAADLIGYETAVVAGEGGFQVCVWPKS